MNNIFEGDFFRWYGDYEDGYAKVREYYPSTLGPKDQSGATLASVELISDDNFDNLTIVSPTSFTRTVNGNVLTISGLPEGTSEINIQSTSGDFNIYNFTVNYESEPIAGKYYVDPGTSVTMKAAAEYDHHIASWTDANDAAYTTGITDSNYYISGKYPTKSELTLIVNNDTTVNANFALCGYRLTVPAKTFVKLYSADALWLDDENVKLCTINNLNGDNAIASIISSGVASAETPLLVYNTSNIQQTVFIGYANTPAEATVYADVFKGTLTEKTFTAEEMAAANFFIGNGKKFVPVKTTGTIAANKCWLEIVNQQQSARSLSIVFEGEATGISDVKRETINDNRSYDLQGRRVSASGIRNSAFGICNSELPKGLYIINGKKVVVK